MSKAESKKNINDVLKSGQSTITDIITSFLAVKEMFNLGLVSVNLYGVIVENKELANITWKARLEQDIGPDSKSLRTLEESYYQAYLRHKTIISALPRICRFEEMTARFRAYPHYHLSAVTNADFPKVFRCMISLKTFCVEFRDHADTAIKLTLENPVNFAWIFKNMGYLKAFCLQFPDHADTAIKLTMDNPDNFARIINNIDALKAFCGQFFDHAANAIRLTLDNKINFTRVIKSPDDFVEFCEKFPTHAGEAKKVLNEIRMLGLGLGPIGASPSFFPAAECKREDSLPNEKGKLPKIFGPG